MFAVIDAAEKRVILWKILTLIQNLGLYKLYSHYNNLNYYRPISASVQFDPFSCRGGSEAVAAY